MIGPQRVDHVLQAGCGDRLPPPGIVIVTRARILWSRVLGVLGRRHRDADLDEEIQAHLEFLVANYIAEGLSPEAARAAARRDFGGVDQMREAYRDRRGVRWIDDTSRDIRGAFRSLSRNRGFTVVVSLTLGLGIAATTAVFSVVNAVMLRPLNTPDGDRVVRSVSLNDGRQLEFSDPYTLKAWQELPAVFEDVSAHRLDSVNVADGPEPEQVPVARVSEGFFRVFRAPILAGRTFTAEEDRPDGPPVAVLSASFWLRRFHGDRSVIGHTVRLGRTPYVILGVLGAAFDSEQFEPRPELWLPLQGLNACWVQQRKHEIGIRLALGAQPIGVARMIVVDGARIAMIGVGIGVLAAIGVTQVMKGLVFAVTPRDPVVFGGVVLLLASVSLLAVAIPARRASRIDPLPTLRAE
jgi:hypothetical protein